MQLGNDTQTATVAETPDPKLFGPEARVLSSPEGSDSLVDTVKHYWRSVMDTSILEPVHGLVDEANENLKQQEMDQAHPIYAAIAKYWSAVQKPVTDVVFGATTPANITLGILSGGESTASQALKAAAGTYFGWRGSQQLITGRQAGETTQQEITRRVMGGVQAVTGAAGAVEGGIGAKEAFRAYIQNTLGLGGELSSKVRAAVDKNEQIEKSIPGGLNQIKTDAAKVINQQNSEFEAQYAKLNEKATTPVTSVDDIKTEIINSIKAKGVQDAEISKIQNKIFAALPGNGPSIVQPTAAIRAAADLSKFLSDSGMELPAIREALVRQKYQPEQIDSAFKAAFPEANPAAEANVSYEMTRRVKTDLWEAAQSATDSDVRAGLLAARENIVGMRQRYADSLGFGKQQGEVDAAYMKFKRDLGSGDMADFISANDYSEQNAILKQATKLTDPAQGEALRGLFRLAGVDTSPLKRALEDQKAFASADTIVPGKSDLELAGKSNLQIRSEALRAMANNSKKAGITNPFALTQIMYGMAQLAFGSAFGLLHIGRGMAPSGIQRMLGSESFQNWVAQESGVTPEALPKFKEAISKSAPYLKKMAVSTAVAGAINKANQPANPEPSQTEPSPAPNQAAGDIQISQ